MAGHRDVGRFDEWSESYDRSRLQRIIFDPVQEHIVGVSSREAPSVHTIVDVGCGTGRLLERLRNAYPNARLLGVDAAEGMVRVAALRPGVIATVATSEALPIASGSVDMLFTTMSFHHWADQRSGLAEACRVLAPGGRLLLADGIVTWWLRPFFAMARARSRMHTAAELDALFIGAGLQPAGRSVVPGLWGGVAVSVAVAP